MIRDANIKSNTICRVLLLTLLVSLAGFATAQDDSTADSEANTMAQTSEAEDPTTGSQPAPDLEDGELESAELSAEDVEEAQQEALAEEDAATGGADPSVCAACHGADGNSSVPQWPKIAGQHRQYLVRHQLLIQSGERPVPEMMPIVAGMTEEDFETLADYFAEQQLRPGVADESLVDAGQQLYRAGNPETNVPACMACHGPAGAGDPLSGYPRLSGQHALYTANMLRKYRDGVQWGEEDSQSKVMVGVAAELTDEEIEAVASYLEGLHNRQATGQAGSAQR